MKLPELVQTKVTNADEEVASALHYYDINGNEAWIELSAIIGVVVKHIKLPNVEAALQVTAIELNGSGERLCRHSVDEVGSLIYSLSIG